MSIKRNNITLSDAAFTLWKSLSEDEWQSLPNANPRTIRTLLKFDLIDYSATTGEKQYKLSYRGKELLKQFMKPSIRRTDDMCPKCGQNRRHVNDAGFKFPYCLACSHETQRNWAAQHKRQPGSLCACGKPRHISKHGHVHSLCLDCKRKYDRINQRSRMERRIARIKAGEVMICHRCGKNPLYLAGNTLYEVCHDCYREQQLVANRRRYFRKVIGS